MNISFRIFSGPSRYYKGFTLYYLKRSGVLYRIAKLRYSFDEFESLSEKQQKELSPALAVILQLTEEQAYSHDRDYEAENIGDCDTLDIHYRISDEATFDKQLTRVFNELEEEKTDMTEKAKKDSQDAAATAATASIKKDDKKKKAAAAKPAKKDAKKAPAEKKEGQIFKEGTKYAYVHELLKKGITMEKLIKAMDTKYGSPTSEPSNVRLYVSTIGKKTKVSKDEKTGVFTAK